MNNQTNPKNTPQAVAMAIVFGIGLTVMFTIFAVISGAEPKTIKRAAISGLVIGIVGGGYYGYTHN